MLQKTGNPLRFVQIGDLHIADAGLPNHLDLRRIVQEVNGNTAGKIHFVYLPGDNGAPKQFRIGAFAGLTITANILMSLAVDRFGMFGMEVHELSTGRMAGAAPMVAGIALISKF